MSNNPISRTLVVIALATALGTAACGTPAAPTDSTVAAGALPVVTVYKSPT